MAATITVTDANGGDSAVVEVGVQGPQGIPGSVGFDNVFNADDYLLGDGTAEDTAWATMIAAVVAAGGGTIQFGAKTYRLDNTWIPTYSGSPPRQVPIVIQGAASDQTGGTGLSPVGGTIFDLRYDAAGAVAKWDTRGLGSLMIYNCAFLSNGTATNGTPFVKTTNTHLHISNCFFRGNTAGPTANQDAIVLGGTTTASYGGSGADQPFQGYGTVLEGNYFTQIRRAVYGRAFCNGVIIQNNTVWSSCGGVAAFELDGFGDNCTGNTFSGNLVEVANYTHVVKLTKSSINNFTNNNYYDYTGSPFVSYYYFGTASNFNSVIDGYHDDNGTWGTAVSSAVLNQNTRITTHQAQYSLFSESVRFIGGSTWPRFYNPSSVVVTGPGWLNSAGDEWLTTTNYNSGTGFGELNFKFIPSGGGTETVGFLQRATSTRGDLYLGSTEGRVGCVGGDFSVVFKNGNTLNLTDNANTPVSFTSGVLTVPQLTTRSYRPTYSASITPAPASGEHIRIEVTNGTAFTINAPSSATAGQRIIIEVNNRSGGAMGTITWDATYIMSGWTNPADTKTRTVMFVYDSFRARWMQVGAVSPDLGA